ncbi:type VI secretion system-associated protein VasI [Burkholderia cenocepacia]|uniref:Type VI secretion system-associated protein TagO n=1 Tax=Burkholderia cenocepacia TaxID=95486 RepID=A0A3S9N6H1_9BURK|nr:type VI secretion system-associated protein VasI [Burkholderia cenocepacia]AZQ51278.1 type VI secretion system-associated protein TagO [Burkholderia cenocepacia]
MKSFSLALLFAAALAGCDGKHPAVAASNDCTTIVSPQERLACFDAKAGTPPPSPPASLQAKAPAAPPTPASTPASAMRPNITALVQANEAKRRADDTGLLLMRTQEKLPGQDEVVISAPALGGSTPAPTLAISCLQNISRLQLLTTEALPFNRANLRLLLDGRPVSASQPWQVLDDGTVTDAGRGLVAIEQLRHLARPAQRLQIESDQPPFDGLVFDVSRLHEHLVQQREACHW